MALTTVTVAIPIFNGGAALGGVLSAIASQRFEGDVELLVCDSGSTDGSRERALAAGARVLDIPPGSFVHGPARNLLMSEARGEFVALLSQDAQPIDDRWLEGLVSGFALAPDVALAYGPYRPRPESARRGAEDTERFFGALSPDGRPRVDRLDARERALPAAVLFGKRTYFTDANGCVRRAAWERVPFPPAPYAEDHALALAMLRAGYAKVYVPAAGVLHSHEYTVGQELRRAFDDWRGLREVYGWREPSTARHWVLQLRGRLGAEWRALQAAGVPPARRPRALAAAAVAHAAHLTGAILGSRSDRLPPSARRRLSLEGRSTFIPLTTEAGDAELRTSGSGARR